MIVQVIKGLDIVPSIWRMMLQSNVLQTLVEYSINKVAFIFSFSTKILHGLVTCFLSQFFMVK